MTGRFDTRKPIMISLTLSTLKGCSCYVDEEHHNRVECHEDCYGIHRVAELSLREDSMVESEDTGFDEEQRPWVHQLISIPMLKGWDEYNGQVKVCTMLPTVGQPRLLIIANLSHDFSHTLCPS